jgi:hypothetical protein
MTRHVLKVDFKYANAILNGKKSFEVRKNDRNFMVGDEIVFKVLIDKGSYVGAEAAHPLNGIVYRIDYVLNNFEGLAQKYVAFSMSREG